MHHRFCSNLLCILGSYRTQIFLALDSTSRPVKPRCSTYSNAFFVHQVVHVKPRITQVGIQLMEPRCIIGCIALEQQPL